MSGSALRLQNVRKSFGAVEVLRDLNLDIAVGEFTAIVGPSGCGKTTLLNLLSGFEQPTAGSVIRQGQVRMVYQQDGLFPWLTAAENIDLGLRDIQDPALRSRQLEELLQLIRLSGFQEHYPHQLSGGMRQRVELARALAGSSDILLLDEPFSALDYITRMHMRRELSNLLDIKPRTVVLVTHDIEEAAQLADRILVLSGGPSNVLKTLLVHGERLRNPTHPEVTIVVDEIAAILGLNLDYHEQDRTPTPMDRI